MVVPGIDKDNLLKFYKVLFEVIRKDFSHYKPDFLARRIQKRMEKIKINSLEEYLTALQGDKTEAFKLFEELSINYTKFIRDPVKFRILKEYVFPTLLSRRKNKDKKIRIWSAGCANGEEPYSIAIMLSETLDIGKENIRDWDISILATDVNEAALEQGRKGRYGYEPVSLENMSGFYLNKFFCREGKYFVVKDEIKRLVRFAGSDLVADSPPAKYLDVIFCRNVLIYLNVPTTRKVLLDFHASLNESGWIFLGNFEMLEESFLTRYERISKYGDYIYRKITAGSPLHREKLEIEKKMKAVLK